MPAIDNDECNVLGDVRIKGLHIVGLLCSTQCAGSIVIATLDAVRALRDAGICIAGGFHSPMEKECLDFLLRGQQPVIVVLAKALGRPRLSPQWQAALDAGRLLIVSPFPDTARRITQANAQARNDYVADHATALLIPHASPAGKTEALAFRVLETKSKPVFTFDVPENANLLTRGARPYDLAAVRHVLHTLNPNENA